MLNRFSFSTVSFSRNALLSASMLLLWAILGSTFYINAEKIKDAFRMSQFFEKTSASAAPLKSFRVCR